MVLKGTELKLHNALALAEQGLAVIRTGGGRLDLTELRQVDSSAVAVMITWQREALTLQRSLEFVGVSTGLQSLIQLYGLTEFFSIVAANSERH